MKLKYNLSTYFILPSISIQMSELDRHQILVNAYLFNNRLEIKFPNSCFLKLRIPVYTPDILKIDTQLRSNKLFQFSRNYDFHEVVYMFSYPKEFLPDIRLIIAGKYSQVSELYKNTFFTMWDEDEFGIKSATFYNQVFNKDELLREWQEQEYGIDLSESPEYFSRMDLEDETMQ